MMQAAPQPQQTPIPAAVAATAATPNAKDLMNRLLSTMDALSQVIEEETPIIEAREYNKQDVFIRRKQELTLDYQSMLNVLSQNQSLLTSLSKDDIAQLRSSGKKLDELAHKNATIIRSAHHASEQVLKIVINEIRKDLHKESGYSGRGVMAMAEAHKARPISINQRV
ncbi:MAG: hypothetical protein K2Q32_04080 [Alphaproteobacteria bacterium]|nr:hypothetical protein [Alphaproteobacteria bacterium]